MQEVVGKGWWGFVGRVGRGRGCVWGINIAFLCGLLRCLFEFFY